MISRAKSSHHKPDEIGDKKKPLTLISQSAFMLNKFGKAKDNQGKIEVIPPIEEHKFSHNINTNPFKSKADCQKFTLITHSPIKLNFTDHLNELKNRDTNESEVNDEKLIDIYSNLVQMNSIDLTPINDPNKRDYMMETDKKV